MLENLSLDGKSIVITGGGTGLGREMTLAMARAGADLVIASRRTGPIEEVAEKSPEKIIKVWVDPGIGLASYQARQLAFGLGLSGTAMNECTK